MSDEEVTIRLLGAPGALFAATVHHTHALHDEVSEAVAAREAFLSRLSDEFSLFLSAVHSTVGRLWEVVGPAADDAARAPGPTVDLELPVPRAAASRIPVVLAVLESADQYCEQGMLRTPPAPAEIRRMRRWVTAEVTRQLDGEPARPWPEYAAVH